MTEVKQLTRESLLSFTAPPKEFEIVGYGSVFVRRIPSGERLRLTELYDANKKDIPDVPEKTVILGICNRDGQPLFTESDMGAIKALPDELVQGMALAVVKGNGMDPENVKIAEGN